MIASPRVRLNNQMEMPVLGLGVLDRPARDQTARVVEAALALGYRLVDTAASYGNERQVGEAVRSSGIPRSEIFITTKLWLADYGYESALRAFDASLRRLGLDYLDLYLLHWPLPTDFEATLASYRAAERLLGEGRVRAIGVSNFGARDLTSLMQRSEIVPAVNQVELHPLFAQGELRALHAQHGIVTQAWSPLGGSVRRMRGAAAADPLAHPVVAELALKHDKTSAQIILRWHLEQGITVIPKSFRPERLAENLDVFDFTLAIDEIAAIDALDTGLRSGPDPEVITATTFPIKVED